MKLAGKRLLVTGASGGIGAALCELLAAQGVHLVLSGSQPDNLQRLIATLPGNHDLIVADLNGNEGRERVVQACQQNGGLDGIINLAGVLDFAMFEQQPAASIENTLTTNLLAPVLLCHALLPNLLQKPESVILNVGSIFGSIGHPGFVSYCASKAGMKSFTEALARELADTPVRVTYIAPRATLTNMNSERVNALNAALGNKADTPQYVAREIVNLLCNGQRVRYLGWPEKLFVHLNALVPGLVHNALVKNLPIIKKHATEGETL